MESVTVHCMVRNEPFVYYAVKSVYDYVDKILLYDTGSYDKHTINDIHRLLDEDVDKKVTFKHVVIDVDETKWTVSNWQRLARVSGGKKGKWFCRQLQILDTETKFFMILDGDEIYYRAGMETIVKTLKNWPAGKLCGSVPLIWFKDMHHTFTRTQSGRLFVTNDVWVTKRSPGELHTVKKTNKRIGPASPCYFRVPEMTPYAHFETFLKPWRRKVHPSKVQVFAGDLPEVMQADMSIVERFEYESTDK
jgi:hypothetical protein